MPWLMWLVAALAGGLHVFIFCMESLWWTRPDIRTRFRQTAEQAETTKLLAFNQGFYNLFLAAGVLSGLVLVVGGHHHLGLILATWNCASMVAAALVLAASSPRMMRGAVIQGAAPLLFLILAAAQQIG